MIAGIVLAAGRSSRFGGIKVLADFAGAPMIQHPIRALGLAGLEEVIVVLGADGSEIDRAVNSFAHCRIEHCVRWQEGQARSLQAGLLAAERLGADAVVVVLADQPLIQASAIRRVIEHRNPGSLAVRASYNGIPNHPVLLDRGLWPSLHLIEGDRGARAVLSAANVLEVPCDGLGSAVDIDTVQDLELVRSAG